MKKQIKRVIKRIVPGLSGEIEKIRIANEKIDKIFNELNSWKYDSRLDRLRQAVSRVEPYQPLYNISGIIDAPKRSSYERCVAIEHKLGPIAGKRILDIGSSLGYVSYYMAERGSVVEGWEENAENAEVSRLVGEINGINVHFKTTEFNQKTVGTIANNEFDVAIILNVFHHIVRFNGLEYTQILVKELLDRVPVLVVELARKGEDPSLLWDKSQPVNELDIFEIVKDEVIIEKVGDFPNHLSNKKRPLYIVSRKKKIEVNSHIYEYKELKNVAYQGSPVAYRDVQRRYYFGENFVAKEYSLNKGLPKDTYIQIFNEIIALTKLKSEKIHNIPELLDFEISSNKATLIVKKIDGQLLSDLRLGDEQMKDVLLDIAKTVDDLHKIGYYHNDVRPWNVIVNPDTKQAFLIDFGLTDGFKRDDDLASLLQLIIENAIGSSALSDRLAVNEILESLPPSWKFISKINLEESGGLRSFIELLNSN